MKKQIHSNLVFRFQSVLVLAGGLTTAVFGAGPSSPDGVLTLLKNGNARFAAGNPTYPHEGAARRAETSLGQHPVATVIACSDSRVPPEILFDEGVGDIFVIRTAGNVAGVHETGSAEYAVEHIGTPLLVVLGHTHCGAVTAVVTDAKLRGSLPPLVAHIRPAVMLARKEHPDLQGKELITMAVRANVFQTIEDLFKTSQIVRETVS